MLYFDTELLIVFLSFISWWIAKQREFQTRNAVDVKLVLLFFKLKQRLTNFRYGHFSGINRKIQFKAMRDKRNDELMNSKFKLKGRNRKSSVDHPKSLLLILKWGGELTSIGKQQAEDLGKAFRCVYPESNRMTCLPLNHLSKRVWRKFSERLLIPYFLVDEINL